MRFSGCAHECLLSSPGPSPFAVVRARIDVQNLSRDVPRFRQVDDRVDNVGNIGYLAHRRKAPQELFGIVRVHGRIDDPRSDRVEPYAFLRVLHREAPRDRLQPAFRDHGKRSVNARDRMLDHCGGHRSDAPTTLLRQHLLDGEVGDMDVALEVRSGQLFEILCGVLCEWLREEDARIIDDTIDRAKDFYRRRSDLLRGRRVADVTSHHRQPLRRSEGGRCNAERVGDHVITTLDEGRCNARTDSFGRTGHDHRLAFRLHSFRRLPFVPAQLPALRHRQRRGHRQTAENPYSRAPFKLRCPQRVSMVRLLRE
jgi:hypothetical protein